MAIYLIRHGETEWSRDRRHTGRTDIPLTPEGQLQAKGLASLLTGIDFAAVYASPLARALSTASLAGFGDEAVVAPLLVEYDYGRYEGKTTAEIRSENPAWDLWRDGCPDGESPAQVLGRALDFLEQLNVDPELDYAVFSHGHMLRTIATSYIGAPIELGRNLILAVASVSVLDQEHGNAAIRSWDISSAGF